MKRTVRKNTACKCDICGRKYRRVEPDPYWGAVCPKCARVLPASLIKATFDSFEYILGLRDGTEIYFSEAKINGEWVHLNEWANGPDDQKFRTTAKNQCPFCRGIDVRLSDIVWCADAPHGS